MSTVIEMRVHMDCPGCESKVKRTLQRMKGVENVDIDMAMQKVTVTGWVEEKKVLKTVRRTGRRAELWRFPYNPETRSTVAAIQHHCTTVNAAHYAQPLPSSSYNYYKHGFDGHEYQQGYSYYSSSHYSAGGPTGDLFSDENPHGCSIM